MLLFSGIYYMLIILPIIAVFYLWITWTELQILKESSKK